MHRVGWVRHAAIRLGWHEVPQAPVEGPVCQAAYRLRPAAGVPGCAGLRTAGSGPQPSHGQFQHSEFGERNDERPYSIDGCLSFVEV
ncbi:hypothetical protein Van01_16290 [Micromonospora andamanensis]|uniref:Uncharacterized protein n=1 Tax=Micromonospora andamanensis TaxID=1287068 RepID=A0ABQ4HRZ0_9ACTN|nr:hypothetical protein Van01_16290 [Micromonospora andamanensis]